MLPGAEIWNLEHVAAAIAFERGISRSAAELDEMLSSVESGPRRHSRRSDAVFALARAVELAMATEQVELALEICLEIASTRPTTAMEFGLAVSAGALTGAIEVLAIREDGILFRQGDALPWQAKRSRQIELWPWPASSVDAAALACRVIPAAVANPLLDRLFQVDAYGPQPAHRLSSAAMAAIKSSDEYHAATWLMPGDYERPTGAWSLVALELDHSRRLELMRAAPGWRNLYLEGSVIDWSLLLFWVALARRLPETLELAETPDSFPFTQEGRYHRELGVAIAQAGLRPMFEPVK